MTTQSDGVLLKGEIKVIARKDIGNVQRVLAQTVDGYIVSEINKDTMDLKVIATPGNRRIALSPELVKPERANGAKARSYPLKYP